MQLLDPLTVLHIALAAGDVLDVAGVDQADFQAARFQQFKDRDPVHPGAFHCHRGNAAGGQPIGQGLQVGGEGAKGPHGWGLGSGRHRRPNLVLANVQAGRVGVHEAQRRGRSGSGVHRRLLSAPDPVVCQSSRLLSGVGLAATNCGNTADQNHIRNRAVAAPITVRS